MEPIHRAWYTLTHEERRLATLAGAGLALTLIVYVAASSLAALAVAAVTAYFVGRVRTTHRLKASARQAPEAAPQPWEPVVSGSKSEPEPWAPEPAQPTADDAAPTALVQRPAPVAPEPVQAEPSFPEPITIAAIRARREPDEAPAQRPSSERRVRPNPHTPLGRLFADRPDWDGPPADPFEPPPRPHR